MGRAGEGVAEPVPGGLPARVMCGGPMRADKLYGSIPGLARSGAHRFGSAPAVIDGSTVLTFADVRRQMTRVAASLIAGGVRPGDRVGVWAPNCAAWIPVALGIQAAGAWLVPLNTRYLGAEAAHILSASDARALFVADSFRDVDYIGMLTAQDSSLRCLSDVVPHLHLRHDRRPEGCTARAWPELALL
jgi:acyl-CoA synthetase (AMP-forming)/AMP-acid ligase II